MLLQKMQYLKVCHSKAASPISFHTDTKIKWNYWCWKVIESFAYFFLRQTCDLFHPNNSNNKIKRLERRKCFCTKYRRTYGVFTFSSQSNVLRVRIIANKFSKIFTPLPHRSTVYPSTRIYVDKIPTLLIRFSRFFFLHPGLINFLIFSSQLQSVAILSVFLPSSPSKKKKV